MEIFERKIDLAKRKIAYTLKKSGRARYLRLEISCENGLSVTAPARLGLEAIEKFITNKAEWILARLDHFIRNPRQPSLGRGRKDYLAHKEAARELARTKLSEFNRHYRLDFKQVKIKNQKSRWGSCSRRGNLNFNYKIAKLPERLAEYIIVHELCHLAAFNHSSKFWQRVAETIPDWRVRRQELRKYSVSY